MPLVGGDLDGVREPLFEGLDLGLLQGESVLELVDLGLGLGLGAGDGVGDLLGLAIERLAWRSETPAGVIQEIDALSLAHFVIRSLMFEAAATVAIDPDRLSFTGCFPILRCRPPECDATTPRTFEAWYRGLLWEMQDERTDPRRNRINPRVIKKPMSNRNNKQPEHRRLLPLKKTFRETVVMIR